MLHFEISCCSVNLKDFTKTIHHYKGQVCTIDVYDNRTKMSDLTSLEEMPQGMLILRDTGY